VGEFVAGIVVDAMDVKGPVESLFKSRVVSVDCMIFVVVGGIEVMMEFVE
jgi:hypothetical protein